MTDRSPLLGSIVCLHLAAEVPRVGVPRLARTRIMRWDEVEMLACPACAAVWCIARRGTHKGELFVERNPSTGLLIGRVLEVDL
jgi:hypothetical protein